MNAAPDTPAAFPIVRTALIVGAAAVLLGLIGWGACTALGRAVLAHDWALATAVVGGAGVVGLLPAWILTPRMKGGSAWGFLAGMALRLPLCAIAILVLPKLGLTRGGAFADSVAALYLLLLLVEVAAVSRFIKKNAPSPCKEPA